MKIILSRKGFDSSAGGCPSPILPDGRLISLPIPLKEELKYFDLKIPEYGNYLDLINDLHPKKEMSKEATCHADPDIYRGILERSKGWKGCFGQVDSSKKHLNNHNVGEGDLFLFFGWFKQTKKEKGKLSFLRNSPERHIIYGYLQVGKVLKKN